jgi:ParB-like chromosome segregation protein Spo0J
MILRRPCASLIPYARNARTHSDLQVAQIAASIREFGFTNPVLMHGAVPRPTKGWAHCLG